MKFLFAILLFIFIVGPATLFSHDLWLVPPKNPVAVGDPIDVVIAVGMDFPLSLNSVNPARLTVSAVNATQVVQDVELKQNDEAKQTVATFSPDASGSWLVSCSTQPNQLEMKAAEFNNYLLHDGLPQVLAQRMDSGQLDRDAREQYSKYTKALLRVGHGESNQVESRVLGQKLEIILLENPFDKKTGETLTAQVLFEGKPLERANLCWDHPGNGEAYFGQTWTDTDGSAKLPISQTGLMTVRLVHMTQPKTESYEWESFWSSFTFHIPE